MAKYITNEQQIGDTGEHFAGYFLSSTLRIIYRSIAKRDTGVDGEMELTEKIDKKKSRVTGVFIKVQVKASSEKEFTKGKLTLALSKEDIEYLTSEMNLPSVLLFADLKSTPHKLYWARIIPKNLKYKRSVEIFEKNLVNAEALIEFKKIESYYRSENLRGDIMGMLKLIEMAMIGYILKASKNTSPKDTSLYENLTKLNNDMAHLEGAYEISFVNNLYKKDLPAPTNPFRKRMPISSEIRAIKKRANILLKRNSFKTFEFYTSR